MDAFPHLPVRVRDLYVAALVHAIATNRDRLDIQARDEEEQLFLGYLLAMARHGHENLLPLTEDRLKVMYYNSWPLYAPQVVHTEV